MKTFYNYLHIFSPYCLIYFLSIHESHCDHFLISDGEFGEVVSVIESKIADAVVGDATVLTQQAGEDSIKYFAPSDNTHPVFVTIGRTDVGKQQIVLSRGEDHLLNEDLDTFVVLRQKGSTEYTVHTAFIDVLDRTTVHWTPSTVRMMDGAEIILEFYGHPDRHHTLDTIAAPNCEWIGSSLLLCSPTTMEVRAGNVKSASTVPVPGQTGGGSDGDGSVEEVTPEPVKPTRPPRPATGSGGGGSGTQTGGGGSGTQTGGGGSGTQTGGGGSGTQTGGGGSGTQTGGGGSGTQTGGGGGSGTQTGGGGSGTQTGGGGSGTQTGGGGSGTQTGGGGGSGTQTGGGGSGTQTGGGGSGTQTGGGGSGTQTGGGGSGTQTGGGGSGTQTGGGGSGTQTGGGGSGTQTGGGGSGTQTGGGGDGTQTGGGGGSSPNGNTGGGDNENMVNSGHGTDSSETFITFKEGDKTRSKGRKVGSFYSPRMKVHKRQTARYQPRFHRWN